MTRGFKLSDAFIEKYKKLAPPFGFNGLGELVYMRTYSRIKDDGTNEKWWETCRRVVEGTYEMQKTHIEQYSLGWNRWKAQNSAQEMYDRMFHMKFLPPGRGLWAMGSEIIGDREMYAALNNCGYVSTATIKEDVSKPFLFLMDMSMLGVGIGFDVRGAGQIMIKTPNKARSTEIYIIPDSREGWVESVKLLLESYFLGTSPIDFDYSLIRPAGEPIKGFGGVASGPDPLIALHKNIRTTLDKNAGEPISVTTIVDIMNFIGKCVVAGNVRRCLRKGTLVFTPNGAKPIENILVGDTVFTSDGTTKVTESVYQGKQELLRINTDAGFIDCTEKHRIAVLDTPQSYMWKHANEITVDDRLVFIRPIVQDKHMEIPAFEYNKPQHSTTCKDIIIPTIDEEVAWLFGLFHGDGYVAPNFEQNGFNAYVSIAFHDKEVGAIKKAANIFKKFGIEPTISNKKGEKCTVIRIQSKQLAWFFSQYKTAKTEIIIPEFIVTGSETIRASYLAGLFDADGSNARPLSGLISIYPKFVEQVRSLYTSIGIPTGTRFMRNRQNNWKDIYIITIKGTSARKIFKEKIGEYSKKFISKDNGNRYDATFTKHIIENGGKKVPYGNNITIAKYDELFGDERLVPIKVLSIEHVGIDDTYDLSVLDKQEFVLGNGLLVHNTAEIVFGEPDSDEYLDLKNYKVNPERAEYGWSSNNSIFATIGMDYGPVCERVAHNGEPGFAWLSNMQNYSRMNNGPDYKDARASGGNPCLEQTLESYELCCLVETFPMNHDSVEDYCRTLKFAYLYAKTVTLGKTHWPETNRVLLRNRRIGCSVSGIAQFITKNGVETLRTWLEAGYVAIQDYDKIYSDWLAIPRSIKTTSVKPSGTVSLLAGATPGVHYPESRFYIRRMRLAATSKLVPPLEKAGYHIEPAFGDPSSVVVEIPVDTGEGIRTLKDVSMWEQLAIAAFMQKYWADNQVSCTITFTENEANQIKFALDYYQYQLKGISFLPRIESGAYPQMPYEEITEEKYYKLTDKLKKINFSTIRGEEADVERFCTNDVCELKV